MEMEMEDEKAAVTGRKRKVLAIQIGSAGPDILNPYRGLSTTDSQGFGSRQAGPSRRSKPFSSIPTTAAAPTNS
jgi:hypothetical protein